MNPFAFRRRPGGFTLLELLVVVVVIGILASLALVKFGNVQERAYVATMQSDLRNFATARAIHISEADAVPSSVSEVTGYAFSESVFDAGYQSQSSTEWALLVGHNKTATRCLFSTLETGGAHRIDCSTDESLDFTASSAGTTVTVDATQPITDLAFSPESQALFAALAASREDIALISWSWGDGTVTSGPATDALIKTSHTYASAGNYTITLTLAKKDGRSVQGAKTVDASNQAPSASFTFAPSAPQTNQAVQFTAAASDPEGGVLTYAWDFGGAGTSSTENPAVTFSTQGSYLVTLTVRDSQGATGSYSTTVVISNSAPTASFNWTPAPPEANQTITFDGSASTDDAGIASYSWTFPGGTVKTGVTTTHTLAQGSHTVRLTVTDTDGVQGFQERTVVVNGPQLLSNPTRQDLWGVGQGHVMTRTLVTEGGVTFTRISISDVSIDPYIHSNDASVVDSNTYSASQNSTMTLTTEWQTFVNQFTTYGGKSYRLEAVVRTNSTNSGKKMCLEAGPGSSSSNRIMVVTGYWRSHCHISGDRANFVEFQSIKMWAL